MPRFAANLSMMYTEFAFLDRFAAARADGFKAVEYLFPYEHSATELAERLRVHGLSQVLFNAPPGNFAAGERGTACLPDRASEFRQGFAEHALPYAKALACPRVHVMAGLVPFTAHSEADRAVLRTTYLNNLAWAAREAAAVGVNVLIEPINTRDIPGYFLNTQAQAHAVVHEVAQATGLANVQVQMDLYHCQIVEGDLAMHLRQYLPSGRVGHIQIAGVPERHEPDVGELHYPYLFDLIDALGYTGHIGCEYRPRAGTSAGLTWFQPYKDNTP